METEIVNTGPHSVENWLWNRLWICRNTDFGMNERTKERTNE